MTDDISEIVEDAAEFIAEEGDRLAEFARTLNKTRVQFGLLGVVIGAAGGAMAAWIIAYRKAEREWSIRSEAEIAEAREHYQAKGVAIEAQMGKGDLAKLVEEKGYTTPKTSATAPMAVQPPRALAESEDEVAGEPPDDSAMAENDVEGPNGVKARNIFRDNAPPPVNHVWDRSTELRRRTPDHPYVIHYDERNDMEGYSDVSFTYYAQDDVLCNERDEVVDLAERDDMVGEKNLERFGHGSNDDAIVFVRNDNLEIVFEIIRSPNSFAEEVHGFTHGGYDSSNLERMRRRERDEDR